MSRLSQYLTAKRAQTGLTLRETAAIVGVSKSTLHRWETGHAAPTPDRCGAIAEAYAVPVSSVLPMIDAARVSA